MKLNWTEILITIAAILVGLVAGKKISQGLAKVGVPIAAGNPIPVPNVKGA